MSKTLHEVLHEVFEKVLYCVLLIKGRETELPLLIILRTSLNLA